MKRFLEIEIRYYFSLGSYKYGTPAADFPFNVPSFAQSHIHKHQHKSTIPFSYLLRQLYHIV